MADTAQRVVAAYTPLTDREREVLAFERQWWKYAGAKEQAIKELFDMSATRYYQVLNALIDSPSALEADPMLIKRLRRLRASRQRAAPGHEPLTRAEEGWASGGLRHATADRDSELGDGVPDAVDVPGGREGIGHDRDLDREVDLGDGLVIVGPRSFNETIGHVEDFLIAESTAEQCHEGNRAARGGPLEVFSAGESLCESPHGQIVDRRFDGTVSAG